MMLSVLGFSTQSAWISSWRESTHAVTANAWSNLFLLGPGKDNCISKFGLVTIIIITGKQTKTLDLKEPTVNLTYITHHFFVNLFCQILYPVLALNQTNDSTRYSKDIFIIKKLVGISQCLICSFNQENCQLQECWNHSTSILSGKETLHEGDNNPPYL